MQKKYTTNTLPLVQHPNKGQLSQYYIQGSHPPLIAREAFEQAQRLLRQRGAVFAPKTPISAFPLTKLVHCGQCGATLYRKPYPEGVKWKCSNHLDSKENCPQKAVWENEIYQTFLTLFNKLRDNREFLLRPMATQLRDLREKAAQSQPGAAELHSQIAQLVKQDHALTRLQSKGAVDPAFFRQRHNRIAHQLEEAREKLGQLQQPNEVSTALEETERLLTLLENSLPLLEFNPKIFQQVVAKSWFSRRNSSSISTAAWFWKKGEEHHEKNPLFALWLSNCQRGV